MCTAYFCGKHNLYHKLMALRNTSSGRSLLAMLAKRLPPVWIELLISKYSFFLGGLLSGLSLFVEEKRRREELAMYVLPKGLESAWVMARGKGWVFGMGRYGDALVSVYARRNESQAIDHAFICIVDGYRDGHGDGKLTMLASIEHHSR